MFFSKKLFSRVSLRSSLVIAMIPAMAATLGACERFVTQTPSESRVKLLAQGRFDVPGLPGSQTATLLISQGTTGLIVELLSSSTESQSALSLARGFVFGDRVESVLKGIRGPLETEFSGTTLQSRTHGKTERAVTRVTCASSVLFARAGCTLEGKLTVEGTRWLRYNTGLLERGLDATVTFELTRPDGVVTGRFSGLAVSQPLRDAIATDVRGRIRGLPSFAGFKQEWLAPAPDSARVTLSLPLGSGTAQLDAPIGFRETLRFNPASDITPPSGNGTTDLELNTPALARFRDAFEGLIRFKQGPNLTQGSADVAYDVTLDITPDQIRIEGQSTIRGAVRSEAGSQVTFETENPIVETTLAW